MPTESLLEKIAVKGADHNAIAKQMIAANADIALLLDGMCEKAARMKFGCEKALMILSETNPEKVSPFFDRIVEFLECDNKILKWGAIQIISNLAPADTDGRFASIFARYYSAITGNDMVAAASVIAGSAKIARAHPAMAECIAREILKVEKANYKTPECRNVAIGHAIAAFEAFFDLIKNKKPVILFVQRQLQNTRKKVALRADQFLKRFDAATNSPTQ
ncbi:MAG: hypothetical protein NTX50_08305 [Candidatus Sumerlaeota bacterium]|nr:hypothetical protein [Candidatus Sumerlaeota bacterium]